jgi:hypothetical protein
MSNSVEQVWELPDVGGSIRLTVTAPQPFPVQVWQDDLPRLVDAVEALRLHLSEQVRR